MKIDKAIEILTDFHNDPNAFFTKDLPDAVKLGIEALKLMLEWRKALPKDNPCFIPGETARNGQNFPEETLAKLRESPLGREPKV